MAPSPAAVSFTDITTRLEGRIGRLPLAGRYHRPPTKLTDDYHLSDRVIGAGASGSVVSATGKDSSRSKFAVKSYSLEGLDTLKLQLLMSEVEVFLFVDHPNVARLFGVYETADFLHFVMESIDGGSLFDRYRRRGSFPEMAAADTCRQILLAVNYIHRHSIVHRDIKLENFVYDETGSNRLKLIDFGFSKFVNPKNTLKKALGTANYAAPEVWGKSYNCQCDLWSAGVIAYVLLTDRFPFQGDNLVHDVMSGNCDWRPELWSAHSDEALDFVRSLLEVDPQKRLTAQAALKHPWIESQRQRDAYLVDHGVAEAVLEYGRSPKFKRCCMEMLAWSLSAEDRAKVHEQFLALDPDGHGTISLLQLKATLAVTLPNQSQEAECLIAAFDSRNDLEVNYSVFLAAMVAYQRIELQISTARRLFRRFDQSNSGFITATSLCTLLGESFEGTKVANIMTEADLDSNGRLSFTDFYKFLLGTPAPAPAAKPRLVLRAAGVVFGILHCSLFRCCTQPRVR